MTNIRYKVQVEIIGLTETEEEIRKDIPEYFENENPLTARKAAITKLYDWQEIFRQAKELGNSIFYSLSQGFEERKAIEFHVPTLHLYVCYQNEKGEWDLEEEFALYGKTLLETEDEQLDELHTELEFYKENKYEIEKPEVKTFGGTKYFILPDSPLMEW